jgi:hypothetical protein
MDGRMSKHDDKVIEEARKRFAACEDAWGDQINDGAEDIRFARLGEQWPEEIKRERERSKRPCLTLNRMPTFIRQVVNDSRMNRPAIAVHPVDSGSDPETAEIYTGLIRNIEYSSDAKVAYNTALENAVTCGWGFFRVGVDYCADDSFDMDIKIERIANPLTVYFDPNSTAADSSDWRYCFVTEIRERDEFKADYPDAEPSSWEGDHDQGWIGEDWIRVAEYWTKEEKDDKLLKLSDGTVLYADQFEEHKDLFAATGITIKGERESKRSVVKQRIITGSEVVEENEWAGKYIPIIPVFGEEVVEEGQRHFLSLVRQAKDAQRNLNYWRSMSTELVALAPKAPFIGRAGAFDSDRERWETANTDAHPFLEYDGDVPPQRQPFAGPPAGAIQESLSANDDLKNIIGLQDASLGIRSNEVSGRAIMARQREGDVSTFHYIDNLSRAIRHAGRILIDLIPKVYKTPRVLRIMGADDEADLVEVNKEYEKGGLVKMHDLTAGKYDLTVKTGPSFTSQREEAFAQMTDMTRAFPQLAQVAGDLIAKNSDWPGADEIAKRLKVLLPKPIQDLEKLDNLPPEAQAAVAQAQTQVEQMGQMIEQGKQMIGQLQQENTRLNLDNKNKQGELQLKAEEIRLDYESEMAKIKSQLQIAANKEQEASRRMVIEEAIDALKQRVEGVSMVTRQPFEDMSGMMAMMNESGQALAGVSAALTQAAERLAGTQGRSKTVRIQAPSGAEYTGVVTEE